MPIRLRLEDLGRLAGEMKARAAAERAQAEARRREAARLKAESEVFQREVASRPSRRSSSARWRT